MTSINQTPPAKQLGEILQDQQEPFTLQLYLLEKGYTDSTTFFKKPAITATNKKGVIIPACTKILRAVFSKLASINLRIKNPDSKTQDVGITKIGKGTRQERIEERFSSASSSTTLFHSCSESDIEDENISSQKGHLPPSATAFSKHRNLLIKGEVPTDKTFPSTYEEENKQHSPVSVLDVAAALSDETSTAHNIVQQNVNTRQEAASTRKTKRFTGELISLALIEEKRNHADVGETNESISSSDISSQYKKIKMALQQTKQLLFDCMREVVETQGLKKNTRKQHRFREFAGPEDLGKLLCENIWTWSRQSIKRTNSTQMLLNLEEWNSFKQQRKEVAMEIGDFILEDITTVIVAEMLEE